MRAKNFIKILSTKITENSNKIAKKWKKNSKENTSQKFQKKKKNSKFQKNTLHKLQKISTKKIEKKFKRK